MNYEENSVYKSLLLVLLCIFAMQSSNKKLRIYDARYDTVVPTWAGIHVLLLIVLAFEPLLISSYIMNMLLLFNT